MRKDICLSIGHLGYSEILNNLEKNTLAEIRIDLLSLSDNELTNIFSHHNNLIATYRTTDNFRQMEKALTLAINSGCAYIDIDINTPEVYRGKLIEIASDKSCKVILSYHNFVETPSANDLEKVVDNLFALGANIAKVACKANSPSDCARIMGLYNNAKNLVAFCMGKIGIITRLAAPILGAPFTYASIDDKETAPGQLNLRDTTSILNKILGK